MNPAAQNLHPRLQPRPSYVMNKLENSAVGERIFEWEANSPGDSNTTFFILSGSDGYAAFGPIVKSFPSESYTG